MAGKRPTTDLFVGPKLRHLKNCPGTDVLMSSRHNHLDAYLCSRKDVMVMGERQWEPSHQGQKRYNLLDAYL